MNQLHKIRLHGPWQAKVIRAETPLPNALPLFQKKFQVPNDWGDWLGADFRGLVEFDRAFGMPTGLEDDQEIWLVIEQVDYRAKIWLNRKNDTAMSNQALLGELQLGQKPFRRSIRHRMQARNRLHLEIELPAGADRGARGQCAGGLIGEVRLEIV